MATHFIDYEIQENIFSTAELKALFDERARIQQWLNIEAALALTQAEMGIIPNNAAAEISKKAQLSLLNIDAIKNEYKNNGNTLLPVLKALRSICEHGHGEFVHYGATTQDIIDTGLILEIKQVFFIFYRDLRKMENILINLAQLHMETPMIGRTHSQHALPITFGLKIAGWATEIRRHIERIKILNSKMLIGQLNGAVGTMAAFGKDAKKLSAITMEKLGLKSNYVPWHNSRDNIVEICSCFTIMSGTIAKIANEIFQLGRSEICELREPKTTKKAMNSSAMPHKRNPVLCERIVALSKHVRALNSIVVESMLQENERDPRSLWAEWLSIPQLSIYSGTMLNYAIIILDNLEVYPNNMLKNLYQFGGLISSEYLSNKLGEHLGKARTQELLHQIIQDLETKNISFKQALMENIEINKYLTAEDLAVIDHPENYIGQAKNIVDSALADIKKARTEEAHELC